MAAMECHSSTLQTTLQLPLLLCLLQLLHLWPSWTHALFTDARFGKPLSKLSNNTRCVNGMLDEESTCICNPCWDGPICETYVDLYSPRFLVHAATAVVPENVTGGVYRAWSRDEDLGLTCPLGPGQSSRCPCASVAYQLFAPPGDHKFTLDSATGVLSRALEGAILIPGSTYTYKLMVQSVPVKGITDDLQYDILDLKIYVSPYYVRKIPWT